MDKDKMWCDYYNKPKRTSHVFEAIWKASKPEIDQQQKSILAY